jgi:hypothetical protein
MRAKKRTNRCGDVGTGNTLDGSIEVVERLRLDDLSADLGSDTEHGETTLDGNEAVFTLLVSEAIRREKKGERETHRLVFFTDSLMVSMSKGRIDLRLTTSTSMPSSFLRISAASSERPTMRE